MCSQINKQKQWIFLGILLCSLLAFVFINSYFKIYAIRHTNEMTSSNSFSIMSFNVDSNVEDTFTLEKQQTLLSFIEQYRPSLICFQELSFDNLKSIKPRLDSIYGPCKQLTGDDQFWRMRFYSSFPMREYHRNYCVGDIDTSGMNAEEIDEYEGLKRQMPVMSADFEVEPGKWVTVHSCHLRSSAYSTARRSMANNSSWINGIPLYIHNYRIGKRLRDYEAKNVHRITKQSVDKGNPVIVVGDLNDWSGSRCMRSLQGLGKYKLKDAWWENGRGFGFTYFGWKLRLRIDHILYSDGIIVKKVSVLDSDLSDHKPLMATFNIK